MISTFPHFLLFSEGGHGDWSREPRSMVLEDHGSQRISRGQWRFVLESLDNKSVLEVTDEEEIDEGERLELLAVVRGLEALEQPSRVTLVTSSQYVSRGIRFGLDQWRESDWHWERFGRMVPIKNGDLWKRVDQALLFHNVECRSWSFDPRTASIRQETIETESGYVPNLALPTPQPFYRPWRWRVLFRLLSRWTSRLVRHFREQAFRSWRPVHANLRIADGPSISG